MPAGRPTIYGPEILEKTAQYIESCNDEVKTIVSGESHKFTSYKEKVTVNLPTIEGLAVHLGIHKDTVFAWDKEHQEFSDLLNILRGKQAKELINKGLSGDYNPLIAKLLLMKHGYRDASEISLGAANTPETKEKNHEEILAAVQERLKDAEKE